MALKDLARLVARASNPKSLEYEFASMLDAATVRLDEVSVPSQTYKPSSLGGCLRNVYFQVTGAPLDANTEVSAPLIGMRDSGTDRHVRIQSIMSRMHTLGYPVEWVDVETYLQRNPQQGTSVRDKKEFETKLYNDIWNLSFMCDGIVRIRGIPYILEIKTESSSKFQPRIGPAHKAYVQATVYAAILGIRDVLYVYENRDTMAKKIYHVTITDEDIETHMIARIEEVERCRQDGTVPAMASDESECRFCAYKEACKQWGPT